MQIIILGCIIMVIITIIENLIVRKENSYYYKEMLSSKNKEIDRLVEMSEFYKNMFFQQMLNTPKEDENCRVEPTPPKSQGSSGSSRKKDKK